MKIYGGVKEKRRIEREKNSGDGLERKNGGIE